MDRDKTVVANWTSPPPPPPPGGGCEGTLLNISEDCSPIVFNLGRGGYRLTGAEDPVVFDIAASGSPMRIGWTALGADEAFLWLDRNGNGKADSGVELFGNATPLMNGVRAPNGFEVLEEFDTNGDLVIDANDPIWSSLLLWTDMNHDGVSQPAEISSISRSSVAAIGLDYHWTGRWDPSGNMLRYESTVWIANGPHREVRAVYDVFLVSVR